ncbi:MAG: peroxiredoxin family protein [Alphaproteobacteria bacterium]|nr:peroxiredoxin family protein [Alphaproteobacteria bacterium]
MDAQLETLAGLGARVVAASVDPEDKAAEVAGELSYPVAYGVTRAQADQLGSWWEDRRSIIQPSEFVLDETGKVLTSTYSSGPVGRMDPEDVVRYLTMFESRKK